MTPGSVTAMLLTLPRAIACQLRRSGNMHVEQGHRLRLILGVVWMREQKRTPTAVSLISIAHRDRMSAHRYLYEVIRKIHSICTTCTGIYANGAMTGMELIAVMRRIQWVHLPVPAAYSVAAAGATSPITVVPRIGVAALLPPVPATSGSGL